MIDRDAVFISGNRKLIWQKYCGFLDLSLRQFMEVQEDLLSQQLEQVSGSPLGKLIMKGQGPTPAEFRSVVPLTTYEDYKPYLSERNEDVLAEKPFCWMRTSGRGGEPKWIPWTWRGYQVVLNHVMTILLLASAKTKGDVNIRPDMRVIANMPPRPYTVGHLAFGAVQRFSLQAIPPLELAERMDFHERIKEGFKMALGLGADVAFSIASVLVKLGEGLSQESKGAKLSKSILHPTVLFRLGRARVRAMLEKRTIMPKDLWPLKAILCGGTDAFIYREKVAHYWGSIPHEHFGCTEAGIPATQTWNKKWMTFIPTLAFYEFIPEEEWLKSRIDNDYQPKTVLLDEVKEDMRYELVITQFYGMPLLRYRMGDLIKIVSLADDETGVKLPQMVFVSRADDIIDIGGFPRLDEKTIWQAITHVGLDYEDWSARKEYDEGEPILRLYLELKQDMNSKQVEHLIHEQLVSLSPDYKDMDRMLQIQPVRVILLPKGSFEHYTKERQKHGAELAHLKPRHINASDSEINDLLYLSRQEGEGH